MENLAILLMIVGVVFFLIEVFIPNFGFFGITGIIAVVIGIIIRADSFVGALVTILIFLVSMILLFSVTYRIFLRKNSPLILKENSGQVTEKNDLEAFIGKEGFAITPLRPAGSGDFDGVKLDILAHGDYIEKGAKIKIVKVTGNRITVKKIS